MNPFRYAGTYIKQALKPSSFVQKNNVRSINNLYSGYELSKKGKAAAVGVMGIYGAYEIHSTLDQQWNEQVAANTETEDIRAMPSTISDYRGYLAKTPADQSFEAKGDLVFALHKLRHGGPS